jgi:hypothetical protein
MLEIVFGLVMMQATLSLQVSSDPALKQELFDEGARRMAAGARSAWISKNAEPLISEGSTDDPQAYPWRLTTDADMRARTSYWSPEGYKFNRSTQADLDRDGLPDTVELVENGHHRGLRITYGLSGKPIKIILRDEGGWSDQGVFAAGPNSVMVNFPESNSVFIFEKRGKLMAIYTSD